MTLENGKWVGENAIELAHVQKRYGDFALSDVSFSLPAGCVLGLIGENGAGKSTLIRMMLGACRADSGSIRVLGQQADQSRSFAQLRQRLGVVLDEACLPEELTAPQIGRMMRGIYCGWEEGTFEALCTRFALPADKTVRHYSRGMKMKLAIACALSHGAELLLLDEATGGLDPVVRDEILDLLCEYTRDASHSILMSSHIVSDLEKICDYLVFLHAGRVILVTEKDALDEEYAVITIGEDDLRQLEPACVLRVLRSHGAVRVLARRGLLPGNMEAGRTSIEDVMLLLEKGEVLS